MIVVSVGMIFVLLFYGGCVSSAHSVSGVICSQFRSRSCGWKGVVAAAAAADISKLQVPVACAAKSPMLLLLMRLLLLFVCDDDDCNDAWNKSLKLSSQCDDAQALLGALPSSEEQELLGRAAPGVEECEAFARALMFAGARQQLMVIDTIMSFSDAAAHIVQSCRSISR